MLNCASPTLKRWAIFVCPCGTETALGRLPDRHPYLEETGIFIPKGHDEYTPTLQRWEFQPPTIARSRRDRLTIAQRFSVGNGRAANRSPEGTS